MNDGPPAAALPLARRGLPFLLPVPSALLPSSPLTSHLVLRLHCAEGVESRSRTPRGQRQREAQFEPHGYEYCTRILVTLQVMGNVERVQKQEVESRASMS